MVRGHSERSEFSWQHVIVLLRKVANTEEIYVLHDKLKLDSGKMYQIWFKPSESVESFCPFL